MQSTAFLEEQEEVVKHIPTFVYKCYISMTNYHILNVTLKKKPKYNIAKQTFLLQFV